MTPDTISELETKVKKLSELLWEHRADRPAVNRWLDNFTGDCVCKALEQKHALYLLSKFLYFGHSEVRELLRAMFQDLFRHPLSVQIRAQIPDQDDFEAIHQGVMEEVLRTRFLGLGNPAESGTHILYDFRLVNNLPLEVFASPHELFSGSLNDPQVEWANTEINRLIFIDDFCGTGSQAKDIGYKYVPFLRDIAQQSNIQLEVWYLTLLATTAGLAALRQCGLFDRVVSVSELDATYRSFDAQSQAYTNPPGDLFRTDAEKIALHYGNKILPGFPFGYGDCQLLVGFHHNVPDNTLPIMWLERPELSWYPIFPRVAKY